MPIVLQPSVPMTSMVSMNSYNYYVINLTSLISSGLTITNSTVLSLYSTSVNGDSVLITSLTKEKPLLEDCFQPDSDVVYNWEGVYKIVLNSSI